ncbi:unknown [Firmicutes bacterium CAG:582]|nr:unknown [Firmicutes bacterium CAG:582]
MAVTIEINEELYKPDETSENTSDYDEFNWMKKFDSDISSRISNHYFSGNSIFGYDVESSLVDYVIKIYNGEIDDDLIYTFNKIITSFIEKKKQEKSVFYLSTEKITIKVKEMYNSIKSEKYKIITIEELINDLYTLLNWNNVLNLGFKQEIIFLHTKNILFEQYYDLSKEEYQNKIDKFSSLTNESPILADFIDNYNKEVQKKYFKDKTIILLQKYKSNDLNTDFFNYFKWKFNQPYNEKEKKYFADTCERNNFLLPKLDSEIELSEWRWTYTIWEIYLKYFDDVNKKKLNNYVNKLKKKRGKKLLEYRINILQKNKPLI